MSVDKLRALLAKAEPKKEVSVPSPIPSSVDVSGIELLNKIDALSAELISATPSLPVLLRDIKNKIKADPQLVTILSEDNIAKIIAASSALLNVTIVEEQKAKSKKKSSIDMVMDDSFMI